MLHAIEKEVVLPVDGKLPEAFRDAFGRKARVIVLLSESVSTEEQNPSDADQLMAFAETIDWPMEDPVAWQRQQRSEWDRLSVGVPPSSTDLTAGDEHIDWPVGYFEQTFGSIPDFPERELPCTVTLKSSVTTTQAED